MRLVSFRDVARLVAAGGCSLASLLVLAASAHAALIVGVNDSASLDPTQAGWFFPTMAAEGLAVDTITLRWDDTAATTIPNESQVSAALAEAKANGVTVELDLYPLHSQIFTGASECAPSTDPQACGNTSEIEAFDAWTAQVARAFPTVHEFVVMNECNQPLFINPQWNTAGQNQSAEICGRALVGAYDALKGVDPSNFVWGVGLSPRGNDNPSAASDSSTSPVAFLADLGAWFRAYVSETGRTTPLMDGFDFHPYPIPQSQPFAQGYEDTNDASVSNLPRIYQAFYNAFNGTPQPTIGQQAGGGLPVSLNEVGVQTATNGHLGYTGTEVSATSAGGVIGQYATEAYQASWYLQMLELVACDPNVRIVNIYHLVDETDLAGWQSGLYYVDHSAKQSAATVHDWIATTQGRCQGAMQPWTPSGVPAAPPATAATSKQSPERILVAVAGRINIYDARTYRLRRVLAPFGEAYSGPIALALGTVHGASELAVAEGPGGSPLVKLLNGKTGRQLSAFTPFPSTFSGGVSLAFAALAGGQSDQLVVGSGAGMPAQVKVYAPGSATPLEQFEPFGAGFSGGVEVAGGELGGSSPGVDDLIVGSGAGMRSQVKVYAGMGSAVLETLEPFASSFSGGVAVAADDGDLVVGSQAGITTVVRAYAGATRRRLWSVDAFSPAFDGGVSLATLSFGSAGSDVVAGAGAGGGSEVRLLQGTNGSFAGVFLGAAGSAAVSVAAG